MGKRHEQTLIQKRHPDGQPTHDKMLNITHHQENTNQTTLRYHLTRVRMANVNDSGNNRCWPGWEKEDLFGTAGGNANW